MSRRARNQDDEPLDVGPEIENPDSQGAIMERVTKALKRHQAVPASSLTGDVVAAMIRAAIEAVFPPPPEGDPGSEDLPPGHPLRKPEE